MNEKRFQQIVQMFEQTKDKNNEGLKMHGLLIKKEDDLYIHRFNDRRDMSDIRSISKTVMTLVTGIVSKLTSVGNNSFFNEETYIYPMIKEAIQIRNEENINHLKQVQVKHLLTHTIGYHEVLLMRQDIAHLDPYGYVDYIINHPIYFKPGEHYLYSNAGFYLLSVVLQEFLQEDLLKFIERELFAPLEIKQFHWEKYGNYLAGATRLWLQPEGLLKIGELLLNRGKYQKRQIIPEEWIEKMCTPSIYTINVDNPQRIFRRYAYGYGIWLAKDRNIVFGHGTDGQTLTIIPDQEMIMLTLAAQKDMDPVEEIIHKVIKWQL